MSGSNPSVSSVARHRRTSRGRVRTIEYRRRSVSATEPGALGVASYVGRVGALAVALGVGSAISPMALVAADTTGSAGSTGSGSDSPTSSTPSSAPSSRGPARPRGRSGVPDSKTAVPATTTVSATGARTRGADIVAPDNSSDNRGRHRRAATAMATESRPTEHKPHSSVLTPAPSDETADARPGADPLESAREGSVPDALAETPAAPAVAPVISVAQPVPAASAMSVST